MQHSLFDLPEDIKTVKNLSISVKNQKSLSKNQIMFNKLTRRIENLEKEIEQETNKCENLFKLYNNNIHPTLIKIANERMALAMVLAKATKKYKFSKKKLDMVSNTIIDLCAKAFCDIEPTPEQEEFYNEWSETEYQEEIESQLNESKETIFDFMNQMFGIDIDPNIDLDNETDMRTLFEKIKVDFETSNESSERKKSKKQLLREEQAKAEELVKKKSIRSIYIALAKVLHPDTEIDPVLKLEKEELMKKVTVAFDEKDLTTLLKLELEWVHKENEHLENLADDKLKIYISALKQQVAELEQKKNSLVFNPRYSAVSGFLRFPEPYATSQIKSEASNAKTTYKSLNFLVKDFRNANKKDEIFQFVCDYNELIEEAEMKDLSDFFFQ